MFITQHILSSFSDTGESHDDGYEKLKCIYEFFRFPKLYIDVTKPPTFEEKKKRLITRVGFGSVTTNSLLSILTP